MKLLIDAEPNIDIPRSVVHLAALNCNPSALRLLLGLNVVDALDEQLLRMAVTNTNVEILSLLISAGCNVHTSGLCLAAALNTNPNVLALLIDAGADYRTPNLNGTHPIHNAASNKCAAAVALLVAAKVDLEVSDYLGRSPLFVACSNPNEDVFFALLDAGARIDAASHEETLVHITAKTANANVMGCLIGRGADVNALCCRGETPFDKAVQFGSLKVVQALASAGARAGKPARLFERAALNRDATRVIKYVASLEHTPRFGQFAARTLEVALEIGQADIAALCIEAGATACSPRDDPLYLLRLAAAPTHARDLHCFRFLLTRPESMHALRIATKLDFMRFSRAAVPAAIAEVLALGVPIHWLADALPFSREFVNQSAKFLTLVAAGADVSGMMHRIVTNRESVAIFLAVGGAIDVLYDTVSPHAVDAAYHRIALQQFELLRLRGLQVCIGLHALSLSALELCAILENAFAPLELVVPFHRVWAIVAKIKHFRGRS
jgi:ankyrin repeat protein